MRQHQNNFLQECRLKLREHQHNFLLECRILRTRLLSRWLPEAALTQAFFLVGCGRSGKSTLGTALAQRGDVCFLDESRPIWVASFPQTDLWTRSAATRQGRLVLTGEDATPKGTHRLRKLFQCAKTDRAIVLQAAAANCFRIPFLRSIFPQARFIHVVRNGLDVAKEIEARANRKKTGWWGWRGYKWPLLVTYAQGNQQTAELPSLCENNFDRGLLDWRLSIEAVRAADLPPDSLMEVRYDDLVNHPREVIPRVAAFLGLPTDQIWEAGLSSIVHRPQNRASDNPNEKALRIGGADLLPWLK